MIRAILDRLRGVQSAMPTRASNHTGSILRRADGQYRGRVQLGTKDNGDPDVRTVYGKSEAEVRAKLDRLKSDYDTGLLNAQSADQLTLREFLEDQYLPVAKSQLRASTYATYESIIRLHLSATLGGLKLSRVTPQKIEKLMGDLKSDGLSPYRIRNVLRVLHRALVYAVRWRLLAVNPADVVESPKTPRITRSVLTHEQIETLCTTGPSQLRLLWEVALATGARQGELLGLQWRDIDTFRNEVNIQRTHGQFGYQPPKNGKSRKVPIPNYLSALLDEHRKRALHDGPTSPVFSTSNGTPLQANNLTRYFRRAARECGIPSDFRFHDLRHTHATLLLRARGVSVADVSKNLGHYSPAVTHGIYNHAEDSNGDAYRAAVEGLIHAGQ